MTKENYPQLMDIVDIELYFKRKDDKVGLYCVEQIKKLHDEIATLEIARCDATEELN